MKRSEIDVVAQKRRRPRFGLTDVQRFLAKVPLRPENGCWPWREGRACQSKRPYFYLNGRTIPASRAAYILFVAHIADDLQVRHKCDNERCVNPAHLEPGTNLDNVRDMCERGRQYMLPGSRHPFAALDERDVRLIRRSVLLNGETSQAVAVRYAVSRQTIDNIASGTGWKHVPWEDGMAPRAREDRKSKKLTRSDVVEIRRRRDAGEKLRPIADDFNVSEAMISSIGLRRTWKDVD